MIKTFIKNEETLKAIDDIQDVAALLVNRGWAERNGGNLSLRLPDNMVEAPEKLYLQAKLDTPFPDLANNVFIITATGSKFRNFNKEVNEELGIIQISEDGNSFYILQPNYKKFAPTSELISHLHLHSWLKANNREEKVVLHSHPTELIAISHLEEFADQKHLQDQLWKMMPEVKVFVPKGIGLVPYLTPGSKELADATLEEAKTHSLVLWQMHGCLAMGKDVWETYDFLDLMNKAATIYLLCLKSGSKPRGISDQDLKELENYPLS